MTVFRIHIRPKGGSGDSVVSFDYCKENNCLGMGWGISSNLTNLIWNEYETEAVKKYRKIDNVRYLKEKVKIDDLMWTRDPNGDYYLAKIKKEWEYYPNDKARNADILNIVRCEKIYQIDNIDEVPGKIKASFRPRKVIQPIKDLAVNNYSKFLWNKLSGNKFYTINIGDFNNIFSFIDSEETEDIIFLYLQLQDWLVIPNSRKADTMAYEFYLIHKSSKERAIVQVKTGDTPLNPNNYRDKKEKVYLFQSNGYYTENRTKNVICLSPQEIKDFINKNLEILPKSIKHKITILRDIK